MSLTRKHLILEVNEDSVLNYDYHYELMKRIYEAIELKDKSKALSLHNKGYEIDNKRFKLFNYNLFCQDAIYSNKGIEIKKDNPIKLIISGYSEVINLILKGFIIKQKFTLDNIEFKIINIEDDKKIKLNNISLYKVRTPVVASLYNKSYNKQIYLNPMQEEFYKALYNNLIKKYKLIYKKDYKGELYFDIENILSIKKKYITNIKTKGFVIGYSDFEIFVQADKEMQNVIYHCGLGEKNSIGMGLVTHIMSRR